jgi:hypothetical protein
MKLKLLILFVGSAGYLTIMYAPTAASVCTTDAWTICSLLADGTKPPHAVDTTGKAIPESSWSQPDKPIILAKDSHDSKWGELRPEAAFDHAKHSTEVMYSLDGKTLNSCVECHHTAQPKPPAGQEYLKKSDRTATLTAAQLEASKDPVQSCRACHFQESWEGGDSPASVKYPKKSGKPPSGVLTNENAYHLNCNSCHEAVAARESTVKDSRIKPPSQCSDCHTKLR